MRQFFMPFIIGILLNACTERDKSGKAIIEKSIERHGGSSLGTVDSISILKTTKLYNEDGALESELRQKQRFVRKPEPKVIISWITDSTKHLINYHDNEVELSENNEIIRDSIRVYEAMRTAQSAEYVFFQPFKLAEENVTAVNLGNRVLMDSVQVNAVSIYYAEDNTSSDKWTYYFDTENRLVANSVAHNNRISLIENLAFQEYQGVLFNKHRKSYFLDSLLNKKYLRAEYFYEILDH